MKDNQPCADVELQRMRDQHVPYELLMLRASVQELSGPEPDDDDVLALARRWMAIECFYIHLRNLCAFFYGGRGKPRDAVATDFFVHPESWRSSKRPKWSPKLRRAAQAAGTMVAHLNYDRQVNIDAGKGLDWVALAKELDAVTSAFSKALGEDGPADASREFLAILPSSIESRELEYGTQTTVSTPGDISSYLSKLKLPGGDD